MIKEYAIKDLFGTLVIVNVNVIKIVILVNVYTMKICTCRKKLVDKLIDECTETIEEVKLAEITIFENENKNKYGSCRVYIVFMIVVLAIYIGIAIYFIYYNWSFIKNNVSCIKFNTHKETKIWWAQTYKWEK